MKYLFLIWFLIQMHASAAEKGNFLGDFYGQGLYLSKTDTVTGLGVLRVGRTESDWEIYGIARLGSDTRTLLSRQDDIYDDNYFFAGVGVDRLNFLPGLRLTFQGGYSWDLLERIGREGWDYRMGILHYWEWAWRSWMLSEYTELLYVHRYRNFLPSLQARIFYPIWSQAAWAMGPSVIGVIASDTRHLAYNRFWESRVGAKIYQRTKNFFWELSPHLALVDRKDGEPYWERRVLLATNWIF